MSLTRSDHAQLPITTLNADVAERSAVSHLQGLSSRHRRFLSKLSFGKGDKYYVRLERLVVRLPSLDYIRVRRRDADDYIDATGRRDSANVV